MVDKKNIILAIGNKEFNKTLSELKEYFSFTLEISNDFSKEDLKNKYHGYIIHEDIFKNPNLNSILDDNISNKVICYERDNKIIKRDYEKIYLPASLEHINTIVINNIIKKKFKHNSSVKVLDYILDKNSRKLMKDQKSLELTEKEIDLILLLSKNFFTKKKEILSRIWNYSDEADTHTVETHIYRLRKKVKKIFDDETFIKNEKEGYKIWKREINLQKN